MYYPALLFISLIAVAINIMGFVWIKNLEDISCECSENWMRDYIKYYLIVYFIINIINLILSVYINYIKNKEGVFMALLNNPIYIMFNGIIALFLLAGFVNIFVTISYVQKLKEANCECSEDIKREIYWYYNIIIASFIALLILLSMISFIYLSSTRKYKM